MLLHREGKFLNKTKLIKIQINLIPTKNSTKGFIIRLHSKFLLINYTHKTDKNYEKEVTEMANLTSHQIIRELKVYNTTCW